MRIGAHESIAGGVHLAFQRGEQDGCEAMQIFTTHNTRWAARPLPDREASLFLSEADRTGYAVMSHSCYLINLGSPKEEQWNKSLEALVEELGRCEQLRLDYLVMHPGAHVGAGEQAGIESIVAGLDQALARCPGYDVKLLLENTAGQGSCLGHRLEHLQEIIEKTKESNRLGVCIDTCHAHAAGYELRNARAYELFVAELDRTVGVERVKAFHLNDSKKDQASRVDRHDQIGEGSIGIELFRQLVNDPRFEDRPGAVETPALPDGSMSFARNIRVLKGLRG